MKSAFNKLSPVIDADISGYEDALDFAFSDENIKNIAVSGAYSSGKSSIIGTYENKHKDKLKFLHISLAHFGAKKDNDEETIESKILNQLLQQLSHSNIPLTRFKVRGEVEKKSIIELSILLSLLLFSLIYIIKFKSWCSWVFSVNQDFMRDLLLFSTESSFRIIIAFVVLIITTALIYLIVHNQVLKRLIRKICFKDYEIEIGAENEDSFFDKYMDEVIYIFENANVDGVIFEDIDRFDDLTVFERIREINTLANIRIHKNNQEKKTLRFFYLIRDDIFNDHKDRTKFFDYIIPVIPVVDGSNSYNLLISYLKKAEVYNLFDDDFLRLISLYIDDLRVAKNIVNELIVFIKNLEGIELKPNSLLAMLTYKNIFPRDYSDLQLNRGFVYEIFKTKKKSCKLIKDKLINESTRIQSIIDESKTEQLESLNELEDVKHARAVSSGPNGRYKTPYSTWNTKDYPRRKTAIEARYGESVQKLENQISANKNEISLLEEYTLSELVTKYPEHNPIALITSSIENNFEEITNNQYFDLLRFLLSNGYIDETYPDYMTFFYPNSLSRNDKIFIRAVADRKAKDFGYHLENSSLVMKFLKPEQFMRVETLNFDLYDLIFSGGYPQHVDNAISLLMTGDHKDFIDFYIPVSEKAERFVLSIIEKWPEFFEYSLNELKDDTVEKISYLIINYCNEETLNRVNIIDSSTGEGVLTSYISSRPNYLSKEYNHDAECRALSLLNVSFKEINYDCAINELFDYVYQNDLYEINYSNICLMLKEKCGVKDVPQQLKTFYSFIRNNLDLQFCQYARDNLLTTMSVYLEEFDGFIEDDQESAVEFINEVNPEMAEKYIELLMTEIESANSIIDTSLLPVLLREKTLAYSASNILFCFKEENELYPDLVDFINSNSKKLDYIACQDSNDDSSVMDFLSKVLDLDEIEDKKYIQIVENISDCKIDLIGKPKVPETKMKLLIDRKCLVASESTLINIRTYYPQFIPTFIALYIKDYMDLSPEPWTNEEINIILSLTEITESDKISILKGYKGAISIADKAFSSEIMGTILEHNFDKQDLEWICQNYSSLPNRNQALILVIHNIRNVIESNYSCDFDLIIDVLESNKLEFDYKIYIFGKCLDGIKKEDLYDFLSALGCDDIVQNLKGKNVKVIVNQRNKIIVELLKSRNIIQPCAVTPSGKYFQRIRFSVTYN